MTAPYDSSSTEIGLDPHDWEDFRASAHGALDDIIDSLRDIRGRPVWRPLPDAVKRRLSTGLPETGQDLPAALNEFRRDVLPYPTGNIHPRFWSWVSGSGSPVGIIADMLAAGMNSLGLGRDESAATYVELQVLGWLKELFGFPPESSGLLVSGCSMANLVAIAVGRTAMSSYDVRDLGAVAPEFPRLVAYASAETHSSVQKAIEMAGIGSSYYRRIPVDRDFQIDLDRLREQLAEDLAKGLKPAILIGNAGTVNTGAIDPLSALADIADEHGLWFAVDGAFGAIATLCSKPPQNLDGLTRADALALDMHKWLHQPYNVGAILIRDPEVHRRTFHIRPDYLQDPGGGLSAGPADFSALGVQLSRSFVSLRIWLSLKVYGVQRFRRLTEQNIAQASYLTGLIAAQDELEILAPTSLNIVNYRYNPKDSDDRALDSLNAKLLVEMQKRGIAAPSSTRIHGQFSIRVCICNHRTRRDDLELLVQESVLIGRKLTIRSRQG